MKFLLDVHVGTNLVSALQEAGHEVVRAALSYPRAIDSELLAVAVHEGRLLITEDSDFSELVFGHRQAPPVSIFYLQAGAYEQAQLTPLVMRVLHEERFAHHMVVIRGDSIRYRPFPERA